MDWNSVFGWLNVIAFLLCLAGITINEVKTRNAHIWEDRPSDAFVIGACAMFMLTGLTLGVRAVFGW